MKAFARFLICLGALVVGILYMQYSLTPTSPHERAEDAGMTCGSVRGRKLTIAQAFPLLPSEREWVRVASAPPEVSFRFDPELPMCRYQGERGCWIPLEAVYRPCTEKDRADLRRSR